MTDFEATITDLSHDGRGVARIDNKATFVSGALPGERVLLKYRKRHRNYDDAEIVSVIEASPDRVEPKCRHFGQCSGCSLQHMAPEAQIAAKQRVLAENFERIGKVTPENWLPPLADQPWNYRRKGRFSVRFVNKKDRVLVGFREESNPRFVADIDVCEVIHPAIGPKVGLLATLIQGLDAARDIPQIEFAAGDDTVALVFRHLSPLSDSDRGKLTAFAQAHGFAIYLQPGNHSTVQPLWPDAPRLQFAIPADNVTLDFLPLDFVQVNAGMNQLMLARTLALLDLQPTDKVLDLFCGLGNFTLPMARHAAEVVGVEGEHGLVQRAAENAARNGISNASFRVANLFDDQRNEPWAKQAWDKILLDPPRAGADKVLEYLPRKGTNRIVYVSCHPGSLARDAGILVEKHGFRLVSAGVMDMFPHTAHVESIALFERG
ncbi:23S rRNA (uracil(1939)-C(5))-methyltransferase RlmD [Luteibacter pinisoli]|uniref:23S rRNA (uracil(1939)-C(5))-methyltransferase RlmD n=1 Tax=Luteibacter pinisoli TaxID=2589080 RepID=A0A4Y5Z3X2_9GAMM|nr:23S rRNA (uracil(1939)-C(5))-methyltransferase RlmD [Luteibacter pinisoli]QDE39239.1 23S rRNA (uracil(1939)-C(5))-methyltransferase RlmD [Luteibacter pinisoli]